MSWIGDKIKEFLEEFKDTIDWIIAGCPKPIKIPVKPKDNKSHGNKK